MTRTVFYKKADDLQRKIYNIVLEANLKAIETVKPGVRFCDIDAAARNHIENFGFVVILLIAQVTASVWMYMKLAMYLQSIRI